MIQTSPDVVPRDRLYLLNEYQDVFPKAFPAKLPSRAPCHLSQPQLDELQAQLTFLLEKGLIEPSSSPFGAPMFFVKRSDGSLRLVCDWCKLNRITIKNEACSSCRILKIYLLPYKEASSSPSCIYTPDIIMCLFESQIFQRRLSTQSLPLDIFSARSWYSDFAMPQPRLCL